MTTDLRAEAGYGELVAENKILCDDLRRLRGEVERLTAENAEYKRWNDGEGYESDATIAAENVGTMRQLQHKLTATESARQAAEAERDFVRELLAQLREQAKGPVVIEQKPISLARDSLALQRVREMIAAPLAEYEQTYGDERRYVTLTLSRAEARKLLALLTPQTDGKG